MKYLAYLLTVCLFLGSPMAMAQDEEGDAPVSAAEARQEKKEAADWYKKAANQGLEIAKIYWHICCR